MSTESQIVALTPEQWLQVKGACAQAGFAITSDADSISKGWGPAKTTVSWTYVNGILTVSESGLFAGKAAAAIAAEVASVTGG